MKTSACSTSDCLLSATVAFASSTCLAQTAYGGARSRSRNAPVVLIAIALRAGMNPHLHMRNSRLVLLLFPILISACDSGPGISVTDAEASTVENNVLAFSLAANLRAEDFPHSNQMIVEAVADGLLFQSLGEDSYVVLPPIQRSPSGPLAVRLDLTSPADTVVELFYTTHGYPGFSPAQVISASVRAGRVTLLFQINDPYFSGGLRFDPGQVAGEYKLHSVELFSSGPIDLQRISTAQ